MMLVRSVSAESLLQSLHQKSEPWQLRGYIWEFPKIGDPNSNSRILITRTPN